MTYLWNSRATGIWSKYLYQGNSKKGKTQGPEDIHYVIHDVRTRTLKTNHLIGYIKFIVHTPDASACHIRNLGKTHKSFLAYFHNSKSFI